MKLLHLIDFITKKIKRIMDCFDVEIGTDTFYRNVGNQVATDSYSISGHRATHLVFVRKKKIRWRRWNVDSMGCDEDDKEFLKLKDQKKHFYQ